LTNIVVPGPINCFAVVEMKMSGARYEFHHPTK